MVSYRSDPGACAVAGTSPVGAGCGGGLFTKHIGGCGGGHKLVRRRSQACVVAAAVAAG